MQAPPRSPLPPSPFPWFKNTWEKLHRFQGITLLASSCSGFGLQLVQFLWDSSAYPGQKQMPRENVSQSWPRMDEHITVKSSLNRRTRWGSWTIFKADWTEFFTPLFLVNPQHHLGGGNKLCWGPLCRAPEAGLGRLRERLGRAGGHGGPRIRIDVFAPQIQISLVDQIASLSPNQEMSALLESTTQKLPFYITSLSLKLMDNVILHDLWAAFCKAGPSNLFLMLEYSIFFAITSNSPGVPSALFSVFFAGFSPPILVLRVQAHALSSWCILLVP